MIKIIERINKIDKLSGIKNNKKTNQNINTNETSSMKDILLSTIKQLERDYKDKICDVLYDSNTKCITLNINGEKISINVNTSENPVDIIKRVCNLAGIDK